MQVSGVQCSNRGGSAGSLLRSGAGCHGKDQTDQASAVGTHRLRVSADLMRGNDILNIFESEAIRNKYYDSMKEKDMVVLLAVSDRNKEIATFLHS